MDADPNHFSRIETMEETNNLYDNIPNTQLFEMKMVDDYYEDIVHFLTTGRELEGFSTTKETAKEWTLKYATN